MNKRFKGVLQIAVLCAILMGSLVISIANAASGGGTNVYLPIIFHDYDSSWQWQAEEIVTLPDYPLNGPAMAIDLENRVHILWDVAYSGDRFIFNTIKTADGWTTPDKIDNTLGASQLIMPPLVSADGQIHLIWYNELAFGGPYRLMYDNFRDGQWSTAQELVRYTWNNYSASLNNGIDGSVNAVYGLMGMIDTSYFFTQRTSSGWSAPGAVDPALSYPYSLFKALPDQNGGVKLLSRNWTNSTIYYSYWKDGNFLQNLLPVGTIDTSSGTILDSQDNVHFYRTDSVPVPGGSVTGIYHQCMGSDLTLGPEEVLTGENNVSEYIVIADNAGKVVFTWVNPVNGQKTLNLEIFQGCALQKHIEYTLPALPQPYTWGSLAAAAKTGGQPGMFCAMVNKSFSIYEYGLFCARVND